MGKKYYAVRRGRQPGIYTTWAECKIQVNGFAQAEYRSFTLKLEARKYLSQSPVENAEQKLSTEPVYLLQYDGASKGNPGKAAAGALLRDPDGSVLQELTMGLGTATNNFAEYKGLILGLQAALDRDITRICVQGDSNLVCKQVAGEWNVNCESLKPLHAEALSLSKRFKEFSIGHIDRELNSAADALANKGIDQPLKQIVRKLRPDSKALGPESNETQVKNVKTAKRGMEPVYILQYDGASKGNPGRSGAGALLRTAKGSVVEKVYAGLGITTNNVAEYEGLILGLKAALKRNITRIEVRGDSNLISKQVAEEWAVKHEGLRLLYEQVQRLKKQFTEFSIHHIDREFNADADALANKGISLPCGTIVVKPSKRGIKEVEKNTVLTDKNTTKSTIKMTKTNVKIEEVKIDNIEGAASEVPVKSTKRRSKKDTGSATVEVIKTEMITEEPKAYSEESSIITNMECALSTACLTQGMESNIGPMGSLRRFNVINAPGDRTVPTCLQSSCRLYHQIYGPRFKPHATISRSSVRHVTRFPLTRRISTIAAALMSFL